MFLACQKSKVTIKLKFYYSNLKNALKTAKIAIDSCYIPRQFLTPLPSIDFREIRGMPLTCLQHNVNSFKCQCALLCITPDNFTEQQESAATH
jgi:hypothetical protein